MLRRLAWIVLPVAALSAGAIGARPVDAPATITVIVTPDGKPPAGMGAADQPGANALGGPAAAGDGHADILSLGTTSSDIGLAAAGLVDGPAVAGRGASAAVTAKPKARLPEPATWLMLIGGMYGIGAALRRRHRAAEAAFTAKIRAIAKGDEPGDEA